MTSEIQSQNLKLALSFDDVLLVPKHSKINSRSEVDLSTQIAPKLKLSMPLISTNMDSLTGVRMAIKMSELGGMGVLPRFESINSHIEKATKIAEAGAIAAASVGVKEGSFNRAEKLVDAGVTVLDVDVAHGHMQQTIDFTKKLKQRFKDEITILSGIIATGTAADALFNAGADCVTVGVGGGSICTTRIQTGCGLPTFASLLDIKEVARRHNKTFMPLAGLKNSGDIVKALATGASAARAGSLFAGTDEAPGETIIIDDQTYKRYNGSTSETEKEKHVEKGEVEGKNYTKHIEGVEGLVDYKGPVESVVERLLAGVRSGFSYCGAKNLEELWRNAEFVRITNSGAQENKAHTIKKLR